MLMSAATQAAQAASSTGNPAILLPSRTATPVSRRILQQLLQCVTIAVLATASYFIISHFLLQSVKIVGRSMAPTLSDSEHYLLNRWVYFVHAPHSRDIVVLRDPSDNGFSVKRIVATPGDSIYLNHGNVYVNGCKLEESYLAPGTPTFADSKEHDRLIRCGKDQYFVLGDNRMNSIDSRTYGPVPRGNILGPIIR
jgi:signal peptidase I